MLRYHDDVQRILRAKPYLKPLWEEAVRKAANTLPRGKHKRKLLRREEAQRRAEYITMSRAIWIASDLMYTTWFWEAAAYEAAEHKLLEELKK